MQEEQMFAHRNCQILILKLANSGKMCYDKTNICSNPKGTCFTAAMRESARFGRRKRAGDGRGEGNVL